MLQRPGGLGPASPWERRGEGRQAAHPQAAEGGRKGVDWEGHARPGMHM